MTAIGKFFAGASMLLALGEAVACSCPRWSYEQRFAEASHVFVARITGTKVFPNPSALKREIFPELVRAEFVVLEVLKGASGRPAYVEGSKRRGADCSLEPRPGVTYLFFLFDGSPGVGGCTSGELEGYPAPSSMLDAFRKLKK